MACEHNGIVRRKQPCREGRSLRRAAAAMIFSEFQSEFTGRTHTTTESEIRPVAPGMKATKPSLGDRCAKLRAVSPLALPLPHLADLSICSEVVQFPVSQLWGPHQST